jgi:hypothetical protein
MSLYSAPILPVALALVFSTGCSQTQTATLLSDRWETGQHRSCLYGHRNLYCFPANFLDKLDQEQRIKTTPYFLETQRDKLTKENGSDGGSYEIKFVSHAPMDFSEWDCYKTGNGSPAIVCELVHKPSREELTEFVRTEREQEDRRHLEEAASNFLMQLSPSGLITACGRAKQAGGQKPPYSGKFDLRGDTNITYPFAEFRFEYLGIHENGPAYMLRSVYTTSTSPKFWI